MSKNGSCADRKNETRDERSEELQLFRFCATVCGYGNPAARWAFVGGHAQDYGFRACIHAWENLQEASPMVPFGRFHQLAEWEQMNTPEAAPYFNKSYKVLVRIKAACEGIRLEPAEIGDYFARQMDRINGCSLLFLMPMTEGCKRLSTVKRWTPTKAINREIENTWLPSRRLLLQLILTQSSAPEVVIFYGRKHSRDWLKISRLEAMVPIEGLEGLAWWGQRDEKLFVSIREPPTLPPEFPIRLGAWIRKKKEL